MTANAFDEDVQASREAGMNEHLTKPIDPWLISYTCKMYDGRRITHKSTENKRSHQVENQNTNNNLMICVLEERFRDKAEKLADQPQVKLIRDWSEANRKILC